MLETPLEAAERISLQMRLRRDAKVFYVAWGSSLKFIGFTKSDNSFDTYAEDLSRLIGAYSRGTDPGLIAEDMSYFLHSKGFKI